MTQSRYTRVLVDRLWRDDVPAIYDAVTDSVAPFLEAASRDTVLRDDGTVDWARLARLGWAPMGHPYTNLRPDSEREE